MIVDSVEKTLASMDGDTNERALGAAATFFKTVNEAPVQQPGAQSSADREHSAR